MLASRRNIVQTVVITGLFPVTSLRAQAQISAATAINRAARLRALSQRSTKLYSQIILDVLPDNARDTLGTAQKLIQVSLEDLSKAALSGATATQYNLTNQTAATFFSSLSGAPNKENLVKVNTQADRLLAEADKLTTLLEGNTKQGSARLINIAGRQRMLSQRLSKNYFLTAAGLDTPVIRTQMTDDRADFKQALSTLAAAPISTPAIRNELQLAQSQWTFFEASISRKPDAEGMKVVATTSERLLEVNNNLTSLYEAALKDLLGNT